MSQILSKSQWTSTLTFSKYPLKCSDSGAVSVYCHITTSSFLSPSQVLYSSGSHSFCVWLQLPKNFTPSSLWTHHESHYSTPNFITQQLSNAQKNTALLTTRKPDNVLFLAKQRCRHVSSSSSLFLTDTLSLSAHSHSVILPW